ncbi:MAG: 2-hydroxyacid dehydrogenase [Xanthobacteraceae bacterium]
MAATPPPIVVVEDDPWTRLIEVVLDPTASDDRTAAFADFMAHDEPDFAGWCSALRARAAGLYPSAVRMVSSRDQLVTELPHARALVVESFSIGEPELERAPQLDVIHKYGALLRNIDVTACANAGVEVLSLRRRANIACAEHAFALMLALARRLPSVAGLTSVERLAAANLPFRPFDRTHVPGGNFGRIPATRSLFGSTLAIIGLGEIGREIAVRAAAFEMNVLYFQRTQLSAREEEILRVAYQPIDLLLAQSDWIIPQLPGEGAARNLLDRERLAQIKPGACLVNVARADIVEQDALVDALRSGRLGGFALDPLYQEPGRDDDELLGFENVILTPHMAGSPRSNGLRDMEDLILGLARALRQ